MKSFRPVLWVSLLVNLVLLSAFVSGHAQFTQRAETKPLAPSKIGEHQPRNDKIAVVPWESLNPEDVKGRVAQLAAAGYPASVIRAMIKSQISDQFAVEKKALLATGAKDVPYWRSPKDNDFDPQLMVALRKLSRNQAKVLADALGKDYALDYETQSAVWNRRFGSIPREKIPEIQAVMSDYSEMRARTMEGLGGVMLSEDREKLALLDSAQRADLAEILTPRELEDYQLRNSTVAAALRSQLALFNPTEGEFRAIFRLQDAFETEFPKRPGPTSPEETKRRSEAQEKLNQQVLGLLGSERYSDYKLVTDPATQVGNRVLARFDLPIETARQAANIQNETLDSARRVNSDTSLNASQRADQMRSLSERAKGRLNELLGANVADAYFEVNGSWLQRLQPARITRQGPAPGAQPSFRLP